MSQRKHRVRRTLWSIAAEATDSASNLLLSVVIARASAPASFGAFATGYTVLQVVLLTVRNAVAIPAMIAFGDNEVTDRGSSKQILGTTLALATLASVLVAGAGAALSPPLRWNLLSIAAITPAVVVQDACIYIYILRGAPHRAFVNQVVWLAGQIPIFGLLAWQSVGTAPLYVLAWGTAAYLSVAVCLFELRAAPDVRATRPWFTTYRRQIRDLTAEGLLDQGAQQAIIYAVGATAGLPAVGGLRAAQVPFGVVRTVIQGASPVALIEGRKLRRVGPRQFSLFITIWAICAGGLAALATALLLVAPESAGRLLLGDSWGLAQSVVLPIGLAVSANCVTIGCQMGLRAADATTALLRLRAPLAAMQLGGVVAGALLGALDGAAWGLTISSVAGAALALVLFWHEAAVGNRERPINDLHELGRRAEFTNCQHSTYASGKTDAKQPLGRE